ncbi:MAG TPA: bifunctional salicylyl-CoA 5-hydroxylase/oxidoreductase, partial [Paracoccus sp.]|nr:bifunctional salicylyl-CoA 5-hydroxylase/oxidoreductase [Paracoccus sp. (in: a-proteobacteria)]
WGFEHMSKEETVETCRKIFEAHLGGHDLMSNADHLRGSAVWMQFPRVICEKWYHENVVLMGDAAATGHFSIGSGSRLAFDSAIALAEYLHSEPTMEQAFERYQEERRIEVLRTQSAARNSLEWFEEVERYLDMPPTQFAYSLLTRSQRISHENLRLRDAEWLEGAEDWYAGHVGGHKGRRPMFQPFKLRDMELKNRIVLSPMAQYKAVDGNPTDWHLIHYAERAKGGAGLIYTEMTCVSPEGRITPGCPGLYTPEQETAWTRLADFIHAETTAKFCMQIGHAGRKASTCVPWQGGMDRPLPSGNWEILAPSALRYKPDSVMPKAMTRADMDMVRAQFVAATEMAARVGADMIELHAAHGYLIGSFISPITNRRADDYGGSLENRMRYPLEVFSAMRAVWPAGKPMSVRISAHDWIDGGVTPDEAVEIARMFSAAGADIIDVSSGQTDPAEAPVYGRMFQTPFSDRIRNEAGIRTMAVGNISDWDQVNGILMAGRADLVCLARAHLGNPYWTLHSAIEQGDEAPEWPVAYKGGRDLLYRLRERQQEQIRA